MPDCLNVLFNDANLVKTISSSIDVFFKIVLGIIGLYLAHNIGRHVALKVSEKRLQAYSALWEVTKDASPARTKSDSAGLSSFKEREALHDKLAEWYYKSGNGMLLTKGTRTMFFNVKDSLVLPAEDLRPKIFWADVLEAKEKKVDEDNIDAIRGKLSIRQLSLLRTRMKSDFRIFGIPYGGELTKEEKEFLAYCGERLWKKPWRKIL